jgi:hypothetical protein
VISRRIGGTVHKWQSMTLNTAGAYPVRQVPRIRGARQVRFLGVSLDDYIKDHHQHSDVRYRHPTWSTRLPSCFYTNIKPSFGGEYNLSPCNILKIATDTAHTLTSPS